MLEVCSNYSIVQYVDYMRGAHQGGVPGAVAPFAPFKIHHCKRCINVNQKVLADSSVASSDGIQGIRTGSCEPVLGMLG